MNYSPHLPNNPYAIHGAQGGPEALALLALAYEIAEIRRILDPHDDRRSTNNE